MMTKDKSKYLSEDELISAINHSSTPYIIVEGYDDVQIYRWILHDLELEACLQAVDGCKNVIKLYENRNRITNEQIVFICDRDELVYDSIPERLNDIIFTFGYSVENDLYYGKQLETKLFDDEDKNIFAKVLKSFIEYYACEYEKYKKSEEHSFAEAPERIINRSSYTLNYEQLNNFKEPSQNSIDYFLNNYDSLIRGHSLFKLVSMVLHRKKRSIKYEEKAIYEICYKFCKSQKILEMQKKIKSILIKNDG